MGSIKTEAERRANFNEAILDPKLTEMFDRLGLPEDLVIEITGGSMALMDALFAIRDGYEWRGSSDPKEIARRMLRAMKMGD